MEKIKDIELEYPELRLITEEHKKLYFNAMQITDREMMKKKSDEVIQMISNDIQFTGDKFILEMVMTTHVVQGITEMIEYMFNAGF